MIPYAILIPGDEKVGEILSSHPPSFESMADQLAFNHGFPNRDMFMASLPDPLYLASSPIQ